MSQNATSCPNTAGATFRTNVNNAFDTVVTLNSGTAAPGTTSAGMLWYDTTNAVVKQRNATNTGWITRWTVANAEGTLSTSLLFTADNTYDIGASGATRPRDFFLGRNATIGSTLTVSGAGAHVFGAGQNVVVQLGDASGVHNSTINMLGSSAQYNWQIAASSLTAGALTFSPSTATGGTTFTTPVVTVAATGLAVTGGLSSTTGFYTSGVGGIVQGTNRLGIDNNSGVARFYSYGPDGATQGGYEFHGIASDGAPDTIMVTFYNTGGVAIGAPTGGDKGVGTVNHQGDIYKNNTAYTNPDYVLEHWATGKIERFADKPGASNYTGLMPLADVRDFARKNLHLPRFGQAAEHGLFSGSDALLASVEEAYLHLFQHDDDIGGLMAWAEKVGDKVGVALH